MTSVSHLRTQSDNDSATGCPLYNDLHTSILFAMSPLELEGWIDQARRGCSVGSLTQNELDALLETAQRLAPELIDQ